MKLCSAGNLLETIAGKGTALGKGLEMAGAFAAGVGLAASGGDPVGAAPGATLLAIGGATTLGSAFAQAVGGLLQIGSDYSVGLQNFQAGAASFAIGVATIALPGFRAPTNAAARAYNQSLGVRFGAAGFAMDTVTGFFPGMDAQQAACQ